MARLFWGNGETSRAAGRAVVVDAYSVSAGSYFITLLMVFFTSQYIFPFHIQHIPQSVTENEFLSHDEQLLVLQIHISFRLTLQNHMAKCM